MKNVLKVILVLLAVIVIPAILAPSIYPFVHHKYPFERVLSRLIMVGALVAVAFYFRTDWGAFKRFGFVPMRDWYRWLGWGILLGAGMILAIELFETALGAFDLGIRVKWNRIPERVFKGLFTGLVVGTIEEFFFRGFLFLSLARIMNWKWSFVITNLFYAFVHFFHGTKEVWVIPNAIDSFQVMLQWFMPLSNWQEFLPKFFGLFLFGCILSFAFLRTGALWLPIGIHAGAVFFLKVDVLFFGGKGQFPVWLYGGKDFYAGLIGWLFLAGFWVFLWWLLRKQPGHKFFENRRRAV